MASGGNDNGKTEAHVCEKVEDSASYFRERALIRISQNANFASRWPMEEAQAIRKRRSLVATIQPTLCQKR